MKCSFCSRRIVGRAKERAWSKYGIIADAHCRRAFALAFATADPICAEDITVVLINIRFITHHDILDAITEDYYEWETMVLKQVNKSFRTTMNRLLKRMIAEQQRQLQSKQITE